MLIENDLGVVSFTLACKRVRHHFGSSTPTDNVAVFCDLFNVMCKQHHRVALIPFLNSIINAVVDGTCGRSLS